MVCLETYCGILHTSFLRSRFRSTTGLMVNGSFRTWSKRQDLTILTIIEYRTNTVGYSLPSNDAGKFCGSVNEKGNECCPADNLPLVSAKSWNHTCHFKLNNNVFVFRRKV